MGLKKEEFYTLTCDKCGEYLEDGLWTIVEKDASDLAWIAVNEYDWLPKLEKWYCPQCQEKYNITWEDEDD